MRKPVQTSARVWARCLSITSGASTCPQVQCPNLCLGTSKRLCSDGCLCPGTKSEWGPRQHYMLSFIQACDKFIIAYQTLTVQEKKNVNTRIISGLLLCGEEKVNQMQDEKNCKL